MFPWSSSNSGPPQRHQRTQVDHNVDTRIQMDSLETDFDRTGFGNEFVFFTLRNLVEW